MKENEKEIWKPIEGFENYEVSNLGRIKALNYNRTGREQLLKPQKGKNGYLMVFLYKDGKKKNYYVHRLVGNAFLPNENNLPMINHKDENKENNVILFLENGIESNLEWCDSKYNINYGSHNERCAKAISKALTNGKLSKKVFQFTLDGKFVREYPSANEIKRETGYSIGNICACCNGKRNKAYGFKWSFVNND